MLLASAGPDATHHKATPMEKLVEHFKETQATRRSERRSLQPDRSETTHGQNQP